MTVTRLERAALLYARLALGASFLSAVAGRFGVWDRTVDCAHFQRFIAYTGQVNAFMPASTIPFLAWAATVAEITCGVTLITGFYLRWAAVASAALLAMFALAMAFSLGAKSPLDYSVFSASAGALLLAVFVSRTEGRPQS